MFYVLFSRSAFFQIVRKISVFKVNRLNLTDGRFDILGWTYYRAPWDKSPNLYIYIFSGLKKLDDHKIFQKQKLKWIALNSKIDQDEN